MHGVDGGGKEWDIKARRFRKSGIILKKLLISVGSYRLSPHADGGLRWRGVLHSVGIAFTKLPIPFLLCQEGVSVNESLLV